jgi:hypothetical protein
MHPWPAASDTVCGMLWSHAGFCEKRREERFRGICLLISLCCDALFRICQFQYVLYCRMRNMLSSFCSLTWLVWRLLGANRVTNSSRNLKAVSIFPVVKISSNVSVLVRSRILTLFPETEGFEFSTDLCRQCMIPTTTGLLDFWELDNVTFRKLCLFECLNEWEISALSGPSEGAGLKVVHPRV